MGLHLALSTQRSAKICAPGLVNSVPAVAYYFCLALPAAFTQPGVHLLAEPCGRKKCRCNVIVFCMSFASLHDSCDVAAPTIHRNNFSAFAKEG